MSRPNSRADGDSIGAAEADGDSVGAAVERLVGSGDPDAGTVVDDASTD